MTELTRGQKAAATRKRNKEAAAAAENDEPAKRGPGRPKGSKNKARVDEAPEPQTGDASPQIAAVIASMEARLEGDLAKLKAARAALEG